jgi:hypothetical protein
MFEQDKQTFAEIYRGVCATYGREANKDAMRIAWGVLKQFDIAQVQQAYSAHVATSKFMPSPAEISDLITASDPAMRRPGPDEAWARMPRSEDDSVAWTDEMSYAWGIASNLVNPYLVDRPDWTAARMAFRDAYVRAVDTAKAQGRKVHWSIARGQRKDNLEDVITEAVRLGYITPEEARPHLLELEFVRPANQQLLLEGAKKLEGEAREEAMNALSKIKANLTNAAPPDDINAIRSECEAKDRQLGQGGLEDAA